MIAAHPDDEILGCGGALARHAAGGDTVHVLIVAEGATSRDARRDPAGREAELTALKTAASRAAAAIGAEEPRLLGLPDNCLDTLPLLDIVKAIEAVIEAVAPAIVYTHHAGDLNVDHRIVHQATVTACRPLPDSPVRAIYAFETVSSTEWQSGGDAFRPQRWVGIEPFLDRKLVGARGLCGRDAPLPARKVPRGRRGARAGSWRSGRAEGGGVFHGRSGGGAVIAVADIADGEVLISGNVRIIRPGHGLALKHLPAVLGRRAACGIARGTPIDWEPVR